MTQRLHGIMNGDDRSVSAGLARLGLALLEPPYRAVIATRNAMFDRHLRRGARLDQPVISVGNLTTGGTGKTPMVIEIARRLLACGRRPAVLLRGYRAGPAGSDEAVLLETALGDQVPVRADPDRRAGAAWVNRVHPDVDVLLLDDGFQHRQVARDLDLVLIDATCPFGHDHVLPRGMMREGPRALRRADGIIVTRADQVPPSDRDVLDRRIQKAAGRAPFAHAVHGWAGWVDESDRQAEVDTGRPVLGVCGIGNPGAFEAALRRATEPGTRVMAFRDHHAYAPDDLARIAAEARRIGGPVVTTDKDWIKWKQLDLPDGLRVYRPVLRIEFLDGADRLDAILAEVTRR
ncbi:MAG: tetraacyldisaccharide 4'-kinase [Phycisphaeraceae bacterium]|nr:tetraacyldisaccharide 4'-kinase [Phycisphaeraceae bacterium]